MRLSRLFKREGAVDNRPEAAVEQERQRAGDIGEASAACLADWVVVDMFAQAVSGQKSPKEAAERAQKRAERYYKV